MPVALVYPNSYAVGMSNLGFQLVYSLISEDESFVCERFFLPSEGEPFRSLESGRMLTDFPLVFFSLSFEHDYLHLVHLLLTSRIAPLAADRPSQIGPGSPLVVCGGVATFMNPEPLAPFIDLFIIGEAEAVLGDLLDLLRSAREGGERETVLRTIMRSLPGCYAPAFYTPRYDDGGRFIGNEAAPDLPKRIRKVMLSSCGTAAHSQVLTPVAEFSDLYLTELGRGCSRGCRFCAAGYIYRPPRLWDRDQVIAGLAERPERIRRIGLLGMEMAGPETLADISGYLRDNGCSLSFSSLRADRISDSLLELLAASNLKSVAIAPDGASERLRRVINKGLTEEDLLRAAERLVKAGLSKLKLYLMIGLPSETLDDLQEMLDFIGKLKERIMPVGRDRGRLCEISLSVNCFTPKPWTPFQFHPFGISQQLAPGETRTGAEALRQLKKKITFLRKGLAGRANVHFHCESPDKVFFQAVLARGDRRLAPVLLDMAREMIPWNQAMKNRGLSPETFAVCGHGQDDVFPWYIIDHGIEHGFLWREYLKSFRAEATRPCEPERCRLCGVCHDR